MRKRKGRKKATGTRAPLLTIALPNARWSVDFVHDQFAHGRRFRVFNVIDDVTKVTGRLLPRRFRLDASDEFFVVYKAVEEVVPFLR